MYQWKEKLINVTTDKTHCVSAWRYTMFFILINMFIPSLVISQELVIPENPLKGLFVLEQKGCLNCHSIKGTGGNVGPDLGQEKFYGSFLQLSSIMWNHSPEMLRRMRELDLPYPEFSQNEMVELISYLYYMRYLGEPGNLYRGKILLTKKGCLNCHSVGGKGGNSGVAFEKLSKFVSPLFMAQALWNHGPEMERELNKRGLKRPKFERGEIVDLSAYIREASKGNVKEKVYMSPGNPKKGKIIFDEKGCLSCHGLNGGENNIGSDLMKLEWNYSVTEIAGLMWNHGAEMGELMKENKMAWPRFNGKEMADLIAYLYFLKFEDKPGNQESGKDIFQKKGCSQCHGIDGKGGEISNDLTHSDALASSINMARILWNHAPMMEEKITEINMQWPKLTGEEMTHLFAYLLSLKENGK